MKPEQASRFRKDIFRNIGSGGITLAITLVTTPMMTRIFPAEAYGINGLMMTAATLLSGFGLFGLPVALTREQGGGEYERLLRASVQMAVCLALFCTLAVLIALALPSLLPAGISTPVLIFLPLMVLVMALQRISDSQVTAQGLFQAGAVARIVNSILARGLTLVGGVLLQPVALIMICADSFGKLGQILVTARMGGLRRHQKAQDWWPDLHFLFGTLKDYRHFALHSNLAALLPLLTALMVQVILGWRFGVVANGQYVLAQSILTLPVSLIALATAPVVFHRLVRVADETPGRLGSLALRAFIFYTSAGAVTMLPVILFGPALFAFVFGEGWWQAGEMAAHLAVPQIFAFSLTGILSLFRVIRRPGAWLAFEMIGATIVILGMALTVGGNDLREASARMALIFLAYQAVMHLGCYLVVRAHGDGKR